MKLCICFMLGFCLFVSEVTSACNETMECTTAEGKLGVCFDGVCLTTIPSITKEHLGFIIKVQYPQNKLKENSGKNFHIRGNGLGFNWKRGKLMSKMSGDTWSINITYKSSDEGFQCQGCSDETIITRKLEYRIFIDDKIDMVGGSFAVSLPVSMTSTYFDGKPIYEVYPWFNLRIGTISNFTVHSPEIGSDRLIALYLPPSYDENIYKKYPKFFIFDVMPNTLQIFKNSLDNLLGQSGTTKEFILIGFGSYLPGGRTNLLTPSPGYFLNCINGTLLDNCDHCIPSNLTYYDANFTRILRDKCGKPVRIDGDGDKVLDFLLKTVLPKADEITQNRMLPGQKYTGIMGYSLGGLMACHAAWTRHAEFGMAGCQSPSLWWPLNNATFLECEFDFINITLKDENLKRNRYMQNILLDAGSAETTNPYRLTQSTVEAALEISRLTNFELNQNVWANIYPNATHSGTEWAYRFWTPLKTLLPSDGASRIPADVIDNSICDVSGTVNHSPTKLLRFLILQLVFVIHLI